LFTVYEIFSFKMNSTVERILLTYLRTLLTYQKFSFADELWTLGEGKRKLYYKSIKFWDNSGLIF